MIPRGQKHYRLDEGTAAGTALLTCHATSDTTWTSSTAPYAAVPGMSMDLAAGLWRFSAWIIYLGDSDEAVESLNIPAFADSSLIDIGVTESGEFAFGGYVNSFLRLDAVIELTAGATVAFKCRAGISSTDTVTLTHATNAVAIPLEA